MFGNACLCTFVEEKEVLSTVDVLEDLMITHDVVFLVMDSREARWLPSLLSTFYNKVFFFFDYIFGLTFFFHKILVLQQRFLTLLFSYGKYAV